MKKCVFSFVVVVVASTSVVEKTKPYNCAVGSQHLKYEDANTSNMCEQTWSIETDSVALFHNENNNDCHRPCINVTAGAIHISGCVNITLIYICLQGYLTEHRIHFLGTDVKPSQLQNVMERSRYGVFISMSLLFLICVGLAMRSFCFKSKLAPFWTGLKSF